MALRILSSRVLTSNLPIRICLTSSSSMSSEVSTKKQKRESIRSKLASIIGGHVDPADPNEKPIPAEKVNFPDAVEHATGEAKLFLLAFENGILDPYCNLPVERRGAGTKDNPVKVESFINERTVACVCEETQNYLKYTHVYKGEPKRCQCGHWLELVDAPKFWEKLPKEDLVTIPYFRELEEEGKLDKLLAGELDEDHGHGHGHH